MADRDLAYAFRGSCAGCGFSLSGINQNCVTCAARRPELFVAAMRVLTEEVDELRAFWAANRQHPSARSRPAGSIRQGRRNPHTLYWQPEGAAPRDPNEDPVGMALTPEWAEYIARASTTAETVWANRRSDDEVE